MSKSKCYAIIAKNISIYYENDRKFIASTTKKKNNSPVEFGND